MSKIAELRQARDELRPLGLRIMAKNATAEFRVSYASIPPGRGRDFLESTAYYTTDLEDAVATGKRMSQELAEEEGVDTIMRYGDRHA